MNRTLMTMGALAVLLSMSMSANAYHHSTTLTQTWEAQVGVTNNVGGGVDDPTGGGGLLPLCDTIGAVPVVGQTVEDILCGTSGSPSSGCRESVTGICKGDTIFGFTVCEQNAGSPPSSTPASDGKGGLCAMSVGYAVVSGVCVPTSTTANGVFDTYQTASPATCAGSTPGGVMPVLASAKVSAARNMLKFQMIDNGLGTPVKFASQLAGVDCAPTAPQDSTYIDAEYLYEAGGELSGFPTTAPSGGATGTGTYTVAAGATVPASAGDCNGGAPWQQGA